MDMHFNAGENNGMWKGGKTINPQGYVLIKDWNHSRTHANGYVMEHIAVLEKKLRRPLTENEVCHHINGIKTDNRPENLEVMLRSKHIQKHHLNAKFVDHSNTVCIICGSTKTKMNKHRNGTKYSQWLYKDDYPICFVILENAENEYIL